MGVWIQMLIVLKKHFKEVWNHAYFASSEGKWGVLNLLKQANIVFEHSLNSENKDKCDVLIQCKGQMISTEHYFWRWKYKYYIPILRSVLNPLTICRPLVCLYRKFGFQFVNVFVRSYRCFLLLRGGGVGKSYLHYHPTISQTLCQCIQFILKVFCIFTIEILMHLDKTLQSKTGTMNLRWTYH